jgi:hypothetical protein
MTAKVAAWVIPILIRCVIHINGKTLVLRYLVGMAVKRPHRPVSEGADDEPYHEKAFEHAGILQHIGRVFESFLLFAHHLQVTLHLVHVRPHFCHTRSPFHVRMMSHPASFCGEGQRADKKNKKFNRTCLTIHCGSCPA